MTDNVIAIRYDKATGNLQTSSARAWIGVQLMRLAERATRPMSHTGISRLHAAIGHIFSPQSLTSIGLPRGGTFHYPSGDYYYNRLLTPGWDYEEDIQSILLAAADTPYTFVDIGANFGFFSCLAASPAFGAHRIIAVEPARKAYELLERNLKPHSGQATLVRLAIDEVSGNEVTLHGDRHAGFSLAADWSGAAGSGSEIVLTTSIDDLLATHDIDPSSHPVLVKLEVEGIEMRALRGASATLAGDSAFIIEEVEQSGISEAIRYVFGELGLSMYYAEGDGFLPVRDLGSFEAYRKTQQGLQLRGTSVLAFKSPIWKERLQAILR